LGLYTYTAPANGITYYRLCFAAQPLLKTEHPLDNDILAVHWLSLEELETLSNRLRSPLVRRCIDDYLTGLRLPLSAIVELS
ncbi:MAG: NUDIX hydrolase, partial [Gammaproteobacteria bacterium]|nr:NUDIX hydrolase [Gammaproteobacteria bacterium]